MEMKIEGNSANRSLHFMAKLREQDFCEERFKGMAEEGRLGPEQEEVDGTTKASKGKRQGRVKKSVKLFH